MQKRALRYFLFLLAVLAGITAGILLGWELFPQQSAQSKPQTLRVDYKTDFVLMVSELFDQDGDPSIAESRLTYLGEFPKEELLQSTILYAQENDYSVKDLDIMLMLYSSLMEPSPADN